MDMWVWTDSRGRVQDEGSLSSTEAQAFNEMKAHSFVYVTI